MTVSLYIANVFISYDFITNLLIFIFPLSSALNVAELLANPHFSEKTKKAHLFCIVSEVSLLTIFNSMIFKCLVTIEDVIFF